MRVSVVAAVLVGLVCGLSPPSAIADDAKPIEDHSDPGVYVLIGTLAVNTGLTIVDVATIGDAKPRIYGFAETILTVPQTLLFTSLTALDDEDRWIPASLALWTGALAVHGIYTLAARESSETSPRTVMFSSGSAF
jgi:hypothetical protein